MLNAEQVIAELGLVPHPEGGFYREVFRSPAIVTSDSRPPRHASTAIYFLLRRDDFSAFHRVASDEIWHHYLGDPIELHLIDAAGHRRFELSAGLAGAEPLCVVPAGVWQAARVPPGKAGFALCGCTVAPGFDFADFELPSRQALLDLWPEHAAIISELTR